MTDKSSDLRPILDHALQAYELARTEHERLMRESEAALTTNLTHLDQSRQTAIQQAQVAHAQALGVQQAEQQRMRDLLDLITLIEQSAQDLLEKAGLAYILGAPLRTSASPEMVRRDDVSVANAFALAQTALVDLRMNLYHLGQEYLSRREWEKARAIAAALRLEATAPLYREATALLCEAYYEPAVQALAEHRWGEGIEGLRAVQAIDASYRSMQFLLTEALRDSSLSQIQKAMANEEWEQAIALLETARKLTEAPDFDQLLCEAHWRIASQAASTKNVPAALIHINAIQSIDSECIYINEFSFLKKIDNQIDAFFKAKLRKSVEVSTFKDNTVSHFVCRCSPSSKMLAVSYGKQIDFIDINSLVKVHHGKITEWPGVEIVDFTLSSDTAINGTVYLKEYYDFTYDSRVGLSTPKRVTKPAPFSPRGVFWSPDGVFYAAASNTSTLEVKDYKSNLIHSISYSGYGLKIHDVAFTKSPTCMCVLYSYMPTNSHGQPDSNRYRKLHVAVYAS